MFKQPVFEYQVKEEQNGEQMKHQYIEIRQVIHQEIRKKEQSVIDVKRQDQAFHSQFRYQLILDLFFAEGIYYSRNYNDKSKDLVQKSILDPLKTRRPNDIFRVFRSDYGTIGE